MVQNNLKKNMKQRVLAVYEKTKENVLLSLVIPILGLVSNVFGVFGLYLKDFTIFSFLYDGNDLKLGLKIVIIIFVLFSIALISIMCIGDKFTSISDKKELNLYKDLINMERGIRKGIFDSTKDVFLKDKKYNNHFNLQKSPFSERTSRVNSIHKIDVIITRATTFIARKVGCDENDVSICLIYKKDSNSDWEILCKKNLVENDLDLNFLMSCKESTFNNVLTEPGKTEFILDKNIAHSSGKYVKTQKEKDEEAKGSIYCSNLSIYDKNQLVKGFVLSIGTKEYAFCNDDVFSKNLYKRMFQIIESNIKNELINSCLFEYMGLGEI